MRHREKARRRVGLARTLSKMGYCSRAQARKLIVAGRVKLNGTVRRDPETPVEQGNDGIMVDDSPVAAQSKFYLMLNKPRGAVTTRSDEKGRETIYEFLPPGLPFLAPVGRLDKASEGLLLVTNDSEWGGHILAPRTHLDKTYHVQIGAIADASLLKTLCEGVKTDGDDVLRAKGARLLRRGERNSWLEIVLDEGKNRHIRRMLAALDIEVLRLVRVAIGPLALGELNKGACRALTWPEKQALDGAMRDKEKAVANRAWSKKRRGRGEFLDGPT